MNGGIAPFTGRQRNAQLEQEVAELRSLLHELLREPSPSEQMLVRIAKTASASTYPTSGNTFGLIFQDVEFTESEGQQAPTFTPLKGVPQRIGHCITGYVEEDTPVLAVKQVAPSGKWQWLMMPFGFGLIVAEATSDITARSGSTAGSGTVQPKTRNGSTYANVGASITIYNWSTLAGWTDNKITSGTWLLYDPVHLNLCAVDCP